MDPERHSDPRRYDLDCHAFRRFNLGKMLKASPGRSVDAKTCVATRQDGFQHSAEMHAEKTMRYPPTGFVQTKCVDPGEIPT
ncbi:hypothetical protein SNOG_04471 [Parastagonospora nodorum SN15]|uniref:Uncharacterized protein n=1 Tax=Phaeosphaeria nodorum (strain SN15 / ATCC MYA-4574 / FGSC 10173) TaxID=321614 RepID=Q0UUU3_PHANO|nr:hypothetical protein SNOG_04471 [Parastagonospora nodorum SN15]EAT88231.1 hypothetical protein SNOG_04471 [Parastagonospora nodorum SN15]